MWPSLSRAGRRGWRTACWRRHKLRRRVEADPRQLHENAGQNRARNSADQDAGDAVLFAANVAACGASGEEAAHADEQTARRHRTVGNGVRGSLTETVRSATYEHG